MNKAVLEIGRVNLRGNIIDHGWFEHITLKSGKPYMVALAILSEIVYWYKPTEIRDEETNDITYKQKFKADKLQKSYKQLADSFGFTKRQVKDACDYLKEKQLIDVEFRTIMVGSIPHNNVMFVEPITENIKRISKMYQDPITTEGNTLLHSNGGGSYVKKEEAPTPERKTNTGITTGISTGTSTSLSSSSGVENIMSFWDQNGFGFNNLNAKTQFLNYLDEGFSEEMLLKAMDIASKENKRTLRFLDGIFRNWIRDGIQTIEQVNAAEEEHRNRKNKPTQPKRKEGGTGAGHWQHTDISKLNFDKGWD